MMVGSCVPGAPHSNSPIGLQHPSMPRPHPVTPSQLWREEPEELILEEEQRKPDDDVRAAAEVLFLSLFDARRELIGAQCIFVCVLVCWNDGAVLRSLVGLTLWGENDLQTGPKLAAILSDRLGQLTAAAAVPAAPDGIPPPEVSNDMIRMHICHTIEKESRVVLTAITFTPHLIHHPNHHTTHKHTPAGALLGSGLPVAGPYLLRPPGLRRPEWVVPRLLRALHGHAPPARGSAGPYIDD